MEPRVGNKFRLGRKIGSGSFGEIYLGLWKTSRQSTPSCSMNQSCTRSCKEEVINLYPFGVRQLELKF
ncbi:hypothetical protein B296_00052045 [Ensete ventricosum]|uniref:Protein kinase domain-containing protein n=1 Tax=Ensete ventricosum TaxID=4639 RepID=A0A426YB29_ENSVE|nr:hypothetical protein B296_00052045 [Ensete ventricosum]